MAGARHLEAGPNIKEGSDERHFLTFSTWSMALWTATKVSTLSSEIIKASHPASHEDASACAANCPKCLCSFLCHVTHGMEGPMYKASSNAAASWSLRAGTVSK